MRKLCLVLAVAACLVTIGCSKRNASSAGASADSGFLGAASKYDVENMQFNNVTLRVSTRFSADVPMERYYRQKAQEFSDMDNGITIVQDNIATEQDYQNRLRTNLASGSSPNIFQEYGGSRTVDFVTDGILLNFQPYFDQYPDWYQGFLPSTWEKLYYEGIDGMWGLPYAMYTVVLYYNKEIFARYNLSPPQSWDDLLDVCQKLMANGVRPFRVGENDIWRLGHFNNNTIIKSLGVDVVAQLAKREVKYDSPEMIKTYDVIKDLIDKGYMGENILSTTYDQEKAYFSQEACAMRWDGSWYVSEITGTPIFEKTGAVAFPYIDPQYKNYAQGGVSDMLFISTMGKPDEENAAAVKYLKYLTSSPYYAGMNEIAAGIFPVRFTRTPNTPPNPLMDEVQAIVNSMAEMRGDVQDYDPQSHMIDTVRSALQTMGLGNTGAQVGAEIVNRMREYGE
ncbi:MAG: extracellular solute-binding protein [Treponema sp.]|jgi:ABC-type glycerol-3-phosphate transport system substrate-binding protein|nr:extracellular solute-binding protein [Treponema sp.]